jgi:hypothetical protein
MKEINIRKYLFEDYDNSNSSNILTNTINISIKYIQLNSKQDKLFSKFLKICMKYKIFLYAKHDNIYILRSCKDLIRLINRKKSEITSDLGKMIIKLHNFDKYLESTSDNFSDIYDTKNKIDQLYNEYNHNYRYLDELNKIIVNNLNDEILNSYTTSEFELQNKNNKNTIIEEYSN